MPEIPAHRKRTAQFAAEPDTPCETKWRVVLDFHANICVMEQTTDQAAIAANLRALKGRRRVSDAAIADGTGLSRSAVNDRLNGNARIQLDDLGKFAAFFDVTIEQLLAPVGEAVS